MPCELFRKPYMWAEKEENMGEKGGNEREENCGREIAGNGIEIKKPGPPAYPGVLPQSSA